LLLSHGRRTKGDIQFTVRQHRRQRRHIGFYLMNLHRHVLHLKLTDQRENLRMKSVGAGDAYRQITVQPARDAAPFSSAASLSARILQASS
jgi:hypothetical protein